MRFDFYAASIPSPISHCINSLIESHPGTLLPSLPVKPYSEGLEHLETGFRLYHGGTNPDPYFVATGEDAALGAEFLRRVFPSHRVTRADVAYDFIEPGGFDRIVRILDPIARAGRVKVMFIGDPSPNPTEGRSMYFGSKDSDVRVRVYEKDLEQLARGIEGAPKGWVRCELQTRPRKARKSAAASMSEEALWGLSKWSLKALEQVLGVTVPYHPDRSMRESTAARSVRYMCEQYGNAMRAFVDEHGRKALDRQISDALLKGTALDPASKPRKRFDA